MAGSVLLHILSGFPNGVDVSVAIAIVLGLVQVVVTSEWIL
eukprot:CAMPEP_0194039434 /NCGR_PEP_ID=MMETSP0009_2-20130614/11557_1 /TAXON_ID=210454 /ORGANISM="Grammatophora oceanica, Strain CCMP 410" /LENGTH=40 /DNA_ID= /DNA_START= /DNA_END= /DNA_ORIENTATION=